MPGTLTLDSAAELAATLAHTTILIGSTDAGYPAFRTLTPHLPDAKRRRHWEKLLDAAARQFAFDDPRTGSSAAADALDGAITAASPGDLLCGVDPERYRAVNPADRPGENDYDGYDITTLALDLASAWDTELVRRARNAVDPNPPTASVKDTDSRAASHRHRQSGAEQAPSMGRPGSPTG